MMDNGPKTKMSLESPEPETPSTSNPADLEDEDYKRMLEEAMHTSYNKRSLGSSNSDNGRGGGRDENILSGDALRSTTGSSIMSKDAAMILAREREEAKKKILREDEQIDTRFDQKKLGKSASHESCQSKSSRSMHGRHSAMGISTGVEVDKVPGSFLFDMNNEDHRHKNNSRLCSSRSVTTPFPSMDHSRSGCRSPGAMVQSNLSENQNYLRAFNRSNSSNANGGGQWTSNSVDSNCDEEKLRLHRLAMMALNSNERSPVDDNEPDTNTSEMLGSLRNVMEMKKFDASFLTDLFSAPPDLGSRPKPRSSSQRGHNNRNQFDFSRALTDDCDSRMTRSELGSISGIARNPRTLRQKRNQQEDRGVIRSEQINGFRGNDDIDSLMDFIEGSDISKKTNQQSNDQNMKKAKKKPSSDSAANNSSIGTSTSTNGNTKKEKVRRSTEGDDGKFSALKSQNASGGGLLSYKHRSTDSLGLSYNEDDKRLFASGAKSILSDDGTDRTHPEDAVIAQFGGDLNVLDAEEKDISRSMELLLEALDREDTGDLVSLSGTIAAVDDEQFIPVMNKKKKNKAEQFRGYSAASSAVVPKYGRNPRNRMASGAVDHTKRSVTPPARETASRSGRRRRNSLDYSRVIEEISPETTDRPNDDHPNESTPKLDNNELTDPASAPAILSETADTLDSNKPSYAHVAATHRSFNATLADCEVRRSKFGKKRSTKYPGSRDERATKDDGGGGPMSSSRQTPRQASSLNASRSSSPVNIPTAVATNLANASSPDLKTFTEPPKRTYATIAADKKTLTTVTSTLKATAVGPAPENIPKDIDQHPKSEESTSSAVQSTTTTPSDIGIAKKCATDTAVNTEPVQSTTTTNANTDNVPTKNLGDKTADFEFERKSMDSSAEVRGLVRKPGDRASCSGAFDSAITASAMMSNMEQPADSTPKLSNIGGNRERRNSCPVQFLDKAGAGFDVRSLNASGLNFVYGDEDDNEEISAALARSTTIDLPPTTVSNTAADGGNNEDGTVMNEQSIRNWRTNVDPTAQHIPEKMLRAMVDYVNKAWREFSHDGIQAVYYNMGNQ